MTKVHKNPLQPIGRALPLEERITSKGRMNRMDRRSMPPQDFVLTGWHQLNNQQLLVVELKRGCASDEVVKINMAIRRFSPRRPNGTAVREASALEKLNRLRTTRTMQWC